MFLTLLNAFFTSDCSPHQSGDIETGVADSWIICIW